MSCKKDKTEKDRKTTAQEKPAPMKERKDNQPAKPDSINKPTDRPLY